MFELFSRSQQVSHKAAVRNDLDGLYQSLANKTQFRWIHQRIKSMEVIWVEAGRSLSSKYNLTERKVKQVNKLRALFSGSRNLVI